MSAAGFAHAPVSKALLVLTGVSSLAVALLHVQPYFTLIFSPHLTKYHQHWRIALQPLAFINSADLFIFELIIYYTARHTERRLGSRKFLSFLILSQLASTTLSLLILMATPLNRIAPGAASLAFALLHRQHTLTPPLYTVRLFGLTLADTIFPWLISLPLIYSRPLSFVLGLLASHLVTSHPSPSFPIPRRLIVFSEKYLIPRLGSLRPPKRSNDPWPLEMPTSLVSIRTQGLYGGVRRRFGLGRPDPVPVIGGAPVVVAANGRPTTEAAATAATTATAPPPPPTLGAMGPASAPPAGMARATTLLSPPLLRGMDVPGGPTAGLTRGGSSVLGQWVNELTDRTGAGRIPSETEIAPLQIMFPNVPRERIIQALQQSNYNQARAVEFLLSDVA